MWGDRLVRIYTRGGDQGDTGLFDGSRVSKSDPRVEAYGTVDELNAWLSLARMALDDDAEAERLVAVQRALFDLGADLATPGAKGRIASRQTEELEAWIDALWGKMPPLKVFILPGGCEAAARLHAARTVCRRAERAAVALGDGCPAEALRFLNRLSDLLFALARWADHQGGTQQPARVETGRGAA